MAGRLSDIINPYAVVAEQFDYQGLIWGPETTEERVEGQIYLIRGRGTLDIEIPNGRFNLESELGAFLMRQGYDTDTRVTIRKGRGEAIEERSLTLGELGGLARNFSFSVGDRLDQVEAGQRINVLLRKISGEQVELVRLDGTVISLTQDEFRTQLRDGRLEFGVPSSNIGVFTVEAGGDKPSSFLGLLHSGGVMVDQRLQEQFIGALLKDGRFILTWDTTAHNQMLDKLGLVEANVAIKIVRGADLAWTGGANLDEIRRLVDFVDRQRLPEGMRFRLTVFDNQALNFEGTWQAMREQRPEFFAPVGSSEGKTTVFESRVPAPKGLVRVGEGWVERVRQWWNRVRNRSDEVRKESEPVLEDRQQKLDRLKQPPFDLQKRKFLMFEEALKGEYFGPDDFVAGRSFAIETFRWDADRETNVYTFDPNLPANPFRFPRGLDEFLLIATNPHALPTFSRTINNYVTKEKNADWFAAVLENMRTVLPLIEKALANPGDLSLYDQEELRYRKPYTREELETLAALYQHILYVHGLAREDYYGPERLSFSSRLLGQVIRLHVQFRKPLDLTTIRVFMRRGNDLSEAERVLLSDYSQAAEYVDVLANSDEELTINMVYFLHDLVLEHQVKEAFRGMVRQSGMNIKNVPTAVPSGQTEETLVKLVKQWNELAKKYEGQPIEIAQREFVKWYVQFLADHVFFEGHGRLGMLLLGALQQRAGLLVFWPAPSETLSRRHALVASELFSAMVDHNEERYASALEDLLEFIQQNSRLPHLSSVVQSINQIITGKVPLTDVNELVDIVEEGEGEIALQGQSLQTGMVEVLPGSGELIRSSRKEIVVGLATKNGQREIKLVVEGNSQEEILAGIARQLDENGVVLGIEFTLKVPIVAADAAPTTVELKLRYTRGGVLELNSLLAVPGVEQHETVLTDVEPDFQNKEMFPTLPISDSDWAQTFGRTHAPLNANAPQTERKTITFSLPSYGRADAIPIVFQASDGTKFGVIYRKGVGGVRRRPSNNFSELFGQEESGLTRDEPRIGLTHNLDFERDSRLSLQWNSKGMRVRVPIASFRLKSITTTAGVVSIEEAIRQGIIGDNSGYGYPVISVWARRNPFTFRDAFEIVTHTYDNTGSRPATLGEMKGNLDALLRAQIPFLQLEAPQQGKIAAQEIQENRYEEWFSWLAKTAGEEAGKAAKNGFIQGNMNPQNLTLAIEAGDLGDSAYDATEDIGGKTYEPYSPFSSAETRVHYSNQALRYYLNPIIRLRILFNIANSLPPNTGVDGIIDEFSTRLILSSSLGVNVLLDILNLSLFTGKVDEFGYPIGDKLDAFARRGDGYGTGTVGDPFIAGGNYVVEEAIFGDDYSGNRHPNEWLGKLVEGNFKNQLYRQLVKNPIALIREMITGERLKVVEEEPDQSLRRQSLQEEAGLAKRIDDKLDDGTDCLRGAMGLFKVYAAEDENGGKPCPMWERVVVGAVDKGERWWKTILALAGLGLVSSPSPSPSPTAVPVTKEEIEQKYQITITSGDNQYPEADIMAIAELMSLLPSHVSGMTFGDSDVHLQFNINQPPSACDYSFTGACVRPDGAINVVVPCLDADAPFPCEDYIRILAHEVIHHYFGFYEQQTLIDSAYCPKDNLYGDQCTFQQAYNEAAADDGIHYVFTYDPETGPKQDIILDLDTPDDSGWIATLPDLEAAPNFGRDFMLGQLNPNDYPNIYAFFKDDVFRRTYQKKCSQSEVGKETCTIEWVEVSD